MLTLGKHLNLIIIALLLIFIIHAIGIFIYGHIDNIQKADVIVVFGNKVERNGTPSATLRSRLDKTIEIYNNGFATRIFASGGVGKEGYAEATIMAEYLVNAGIPMENIVIDNEGINTKSTAINLKRYMSENNFDSVIAVSSYYHIPRIKLYFAKIGINNTYTARSNLYKIKDFYSIQRETVGIYVYMFAENLR